MDIGDSKQVFRGTVRFLVADTLAQHFLGRFNECFSGGNRICRFCTISASDMKSTFSSSACKRRTRPEYDAQVEALHNSEAASGQNLHKLYGLKEHYILRDLPSFHIIDRKPPDIGHDILEGVGPLVVRWTLTSLIRKHKVLSITALNDVLRHFPYHRNADRNPPQMASLGAGVLIKLTASECYTLIRLLPLMIGDIIPSECPEWDAFLRLRDIVFYFCAPTLTFAGVGLPSNRS